MPSFTAIKELLLAVAKILAAAFLWDAGKKQAELKQANEENAKLKENEDALLEVKMVMDSVPADDDSLLFAPQDRKP